MSKYRDLSNQAEDERIRQIGEAVMSLPIGRTVGIVVDEEGLSGEDKADRYVRKLTSRYPAVAEAKRFFGPTPKVVTVVVHRIKAATPPQGALTE